MATAAVITYDRNPFRRFDRETVSSIMKEMRIDPDDLTGSARALSEKTSMSFGTFSGPLADPVAYFAEAMSIELEHGRVASVIGANVTDDDPGKTAMIAAAHLFGIEADNDESQLPFPTYYDWLLWMEGLRRISLIIK